MGSRCATSEAAVSEAVDQNPAGDVVAGGWTRPRIGNPCDNEDRMGIVWSYMTVSANLIKYRDPSAGGSFICERGSLGVAISDDDTQAFSTAVDPNCGPGYYYADTSHESKSGLTGGLYRSDRNRSPLGYNN